MMSPSRAPLTLVLARLLALGLSPLLGSLALPAVAAGPEKNLVMPGEVFQLGERTAFIFTPAPAPTVPAAPGLKSGPKPWVLYSPTIPSCPDEAEKWMHEQFTQAGIAVAGIDSGESYGSPAGVKAAEALHAEMVRRGYSKKPVLLGRSRGGLWASAWAIAHPEFTAGLAGIYPVYDWRTYPGVEGAAVAYGLTPAELAAQAAELCPIERIGRLAEADVPVCIIHGDVDTVVPLDRNSGELHKRYIAAGKGELVNLIVPAGQGHSFWEGFFHCQPLVDFVIARARAGAAE